MEAGSTSAPDDSSPRDGVAAAVMSTFDATDIPTMIPIDAVEDGIAVYSLDGRILAVNASFRRLLGIAPEMSLSGMRPDEAGAGNVICTLDGEPVLREDWPTSIVVDTGVERVERVLGVTPPGQGQRWLSVMARRLEDPGGALIVTTFSDVTDELANEHEVRELREKREMIAAIVEQGTDFITIFSADGAVQYVSSAVTEQLGWTFEQVRDGERKATIHPDDVPVIDAAIARLAAGEEQVHLAHRVRTSTGEWRHIEGTLTSYAGRPPIDGIVSAMRDVTELREAQRERDELARRMSTVFESIDDIVSESVVRGDGSYEVTWISPNYWRVVGLEPSDTSQLVRWQDTILEEDRAAFAAYRESMLVQDASSIELRTQDGPGADIHDIWTRSYSRTIGDERHSIAVTTNITALRARESELADLASRLSLLMDRLGIGVLFEGLDRRVQFSNRLMSTHFTSPGAAAPETGVIAGGDGARWHELYEDSEDVLERTNRFVADCRPVDGDILRRRDGMVIERSFAPLFVGEELRGYLWTLRDISEREHREAEVQALSTLLQAAMGNMNAEVLVEDADRRVAFVNERLADAARELGVELELGADVSDTYIHWNALMEDPEADAARQAAYLADDVPVVGEVVPLASGRAYERDFVPIRVGDEVRWRMWVTRDITHRVRDREALELARLEAEEARAAAESSSRSKSRFLATMSHEIRTPLNGVIGMLELLGDGGDDPAERADMLEVVRGSAEALLAIINDVLEVSKIESGAVVLDLAATDMRTLVEGVRRLFAPRAAAAGVELRWSIADDVPPMVVVDGGRVRQVLVNLVDNALRHTPSGSVEMSVTVAALGVGDALELFVRDTGTGVSPEVRAQLFDPFVPGAPRGADDAPSTGLGLSICQRLVGLMGGEIECQSVVGVGTTFRFTVRTDHAEGAADERQASTSTAPGPPAMVLAVAADDDAPRVLVVEDNEINREIITRQLDRLGYRWDAVDNGEDALATLAEGGFDGVLMDCQMRGLDGYATTRRLRALGLRADGHRPLPVIAVTASAFEEDRARCLAAGMDDVLGKPVRLAELRGMLERHVPAGAGGTADDVDDDSAAIPIDPEALGFDGLDTIALGNLVHDMQDTRLVRRAIGIWLAQLEPRVQALEAAAEAADMSELARAAHELRSTSAAFGASAVAHVCGQLEQGARTGAVPEAVAIVERLRALAAGSRARLEQWLADLP